MPVGDELGMVVVSSSMWQESKTKAQQLGGLVLFQTRQGIRQTSENERKANGNVEKMGEWIGWKQPSVIATRDNIVAFGWIYYCEQCKW